MLEELQYYVKNKSNLDKAINSGFGTSSSYSGRVGLINQGSTCYLNSLIQCLFYNLPFRVLILQAKPDSPIIAALQELFAHLQLSAAPSVTTKDLVAAFGWSRGQVFEQHDGHELFSLLLDALGDASADLGTQLSDLFRGSMTDVLLCPSCNYKRESTSTFLNISLELSPPNANESGTFEAEKRVDLCELLELHMMTETLDNDNKWQCSGCSERVHAMKYSEYTALPPSLMIHLKRFRYNTSLNKREKVTTPVYFPSVLDTTVLTHPVVEGARTLRILRTGKLEGDIIASSSSAREELEVGEGGEAGEAIEIRGKGEKYRLHAILLHTGTANGGHYKAYVTDSPSGKWLECNDASVCDLTPREEASLSLSRASMEGGTSFVESRSQSEKNPTESVANIESVADIASLGSCPASAVRDEPLVGVRKKSFTLRDDVLRENAYMLQYRKITVNTDNADLTDDLDNADNSSSELESERIERRADSMDIEDSKEQRKREAKIMIKSCAAAIPIPLKVAIEQKNIELNELRRLYEMHKMVVTVKVVYDYDEIESIRRTLLEECPESAVRASKNEVSKLGHVMLTVLGTDTLNDLLAQVCSSLSIPLPLASNGHTILKIGGEQTVVVEVTHPRHRLRVFDERTGRRGETYGLRGKESITNLGFKIPPSFGSSDSPPVVLRLEIRAESDEPFIEMSDRDMYLRVVIWSEEVKDAYSACAAAYGAGVDVLAAISDVGTPDQSLVTSIPTDSNAPESERNDETKGPGIVDFRPSKSIILAATHTILIPGEGTATLGALRKSISALVKCCLNDVILIFKNDRSILVLDSDQDHRSLGKAYGIRPFDFIFTEIKTNSVDTTNINVDDGNNENEIEKKVDSDEIHDTATAKYESKALIALQRLLNSITIQFNDPRKNGKFSESDTNSDVTYVDDSVLTREYSVKVSSDCLIKELKILMADKLGIDSKSDNFYLCKSSADFSPQYKYELQSLNALGLCDLSTIYLKMGLGCLLGEYQLRLEVEVNVTAGSSVAVLEEGMKSSCSTNSIGVGSIAEDANNTDSSTNNDGIITQKLPTGRTKFVPFGELYAREQSSVLNLKETLLTNWDQISTGIKEWTDGTENSIPERPPTVHHIRLRDAKSVSKISSGPLLRNERLLSRCLAGLADGRKLFIQILPEPQVICPSDWILGIRLATYSSSKTLQTTSLEASQESKDENIPVVENIPVEGVKNIPGESKPHNEFTVKKVHRVLDLPISRTATVRELYRAILGLFPHLLETPVEHVRSPDAITSTYAPPDADILDTTNITNNTERTDCTDNTQNTEANQANKAAHFLETQLLSIAKSIAMGPPLTLKTSRKLPWNPTVLISSPDVQVDHQSLGLRDGMLLVVRGEVDWVRAEREGKELMPGIPGGAEEVEEDKAPVRSKVATLPAWKVRSNVARKTTGVTSSPSSLSSSASSVLRARTGTGGGFSRGPIVERCLSLGSTAHSRQATLMQSALTLDNAVDQDPGLLTPDIRGEAAYEVDPCEVAVPAVRSLGADPDLAPPVPDTTDCPSLSSVSDGYNDYTGNISEEEEVTILRMPVAPVEVVRALKTAPQEGI